MKSLKSVSSLIFIAICTSSAITAHAADHAVGDRVMDAKLHAGTVIDIASDGTVKWNRDHGGVTVSNAEELGKKQPCAEDLCEGNRAMELSDRAGTVIEVFSNHAILFKRDHYSFPERRVVGASIKDLYRSVEHIGAVHIGMHLYTTDGHTGVIKALFSNGIVHFYWDKNGLFEKTIEAILPPGKTPEGMTPFEDSL